MTKIYEGGGIYTISLGCSGKTIELTQDEINEVAENSDLIEDLKQEYEENLNKEKACVGELEKVIRDLKDNLDEFEIVSKDWDDLCEWRDNLLDIIEDILDERE